MMTAALVFGIPFYVIAFAIGYGVTKSVAGGIAAILIMIVVSVDVLLVVGKKEKVL